MLQPELTENVINSLATKLAEQIQNKTLRLNGELLNVIIETIREFNVDLVNKDFPLSATNNAAIEAVVNSWASTDTNFITEDTELTPNIINDLHITVQVDQLVHSLRANGWIITPPEGKVV